MPNISWNEIRSRAMAFVNEWQDEASERAEAQTFLNEFFHIFGRSRRRVAAFEKKVTEGTRAGGRIDLLWKGNVLVEMKSAGQDLERAYTQASDYFGGLRDKDLPRLIIVCDFQRWKVYDLDEGEEYFFALKELPDYLHVFGFIANYEKKTIKPEDPVNIEAAELMGRLHDMLMKAGYEGHQLEIFLVRLLFCLFADDTGIFERDIFKDYLEQRTHEDGSDLGMRLAMLFQVLDTPEDKRMSNLDEQLAQFPYVNGSLFDEVLPMVSFTGEMRSMLIEASGLDWGKISPAIFGSLFQSVMDPEQRRNLGAHYTSETNILKLIKPLFLDELWEEFDKLDTLPKLNKFHEKLGSLQFMDPACGCGNFLVITYRELRLLEIEVIKARLRKQGIRPEVATEAGVDVRLLIKVDIDQFYGIEYEEWPARITEVAMYLIDHQMNLATSQTFGQYFAKLPLSKSATIVHGNALRLDWKEIVPPQELNYILGNPPFLGHHYQSKEQKEDMDLVFSRAKGIKVLDYVSAWYVKAAELIHSFNQIKAAFVSTSSISQGEQVGILWEFLFLKYSLSIQFAHRTFQWNNEAKGNAAVHVVVIGFGAEKPLNPRLYFYDYMKGDPIEVKANRINPYLVDAAQIIIRNRSNPFGGVPKMVWGNKPTDGGNLLFDSESEKDEFLKLEPGASKWIKPYISGRDFLYKKFRYCLWLVDIPPNELRKLPYVIARVEKVKSFRLASKAALTRKKAHTPTLFVQIAQPESNYLAIPEVSSERRDYIPIGYIDRDVIASNTIQMVPNASKFLFGILTSKMHNIWMKYTCGRLESRLRYSNSLVYNNYPWPKDPSPKNKKKVEEAAQHVLDVRERYPDSSLADLYDPLTMPPDLVKAHQALDKAVDLCYRPQAFPNETTRIEYLFNLYQEYTAPLMGKTKKKK